MDMATLKELARKAVANADEGIKKAAASVNDGVDNAKAGISKAAYANKVTKEIKNCIKDLEKEKKTVTPGSVHEDTDHLIKKLNGAVKQIQEDPNNGEEILTRQIEDLQEMIDRISTEESVEMTVMSKHYDAAKHACQKSIAVVEAEKEAEAKAEAEKNEPAIINLEGTSIKILIPGGYEKLKYKNPAKQLLKGTSKDEIAVGKATANSNNVVLISKTTSDKAMNFDGKQELIDGIHDCLGDNQGLIEVNAGKTKRGYDFIYSIVKTLRDDFMGAVYFLRMNIGNGEDLLEIQASFEEIGTTGGRESFCTILAEKAGLINMSDMIGWNEDSYDAEYTKGIPMNLSERSGVDALFPDHPLSQARELVIAITEDKKVLVKKADEDTEQTDNVDESEKKSDFVKQYESNNKQFYIDLFAKDPVLSRHTLDIEVN